MRYEDAGRTDAANAPGVPMGSVGRGAERPQNGLFTVRFITPLEAYEREVLSLRLKDASGYFGIMKNHADFITVLSPSLGFYRDRDGKEVFLAVHGGLLAVGRGAVTLLSREIIESEDADILAEKLKEEIEEKDRYESAFKDMLSGIERSFWKKKTETERMKR